MKSSSWSMTSRFQALGIDVLELVEEFAQLVAGNVQALPS